MAISVHNSVASNNAAGGTTIAVTLPTTTQGDVLLCAIDIVTNTSTCQPPVIGTTVTTGLSTSFGHVGAAFGNGVWVLLGSNGSVYTATSPTGTWTLRTASMFSTFSVATGANVLFAAGLFVAVGGGSTTGAIGYSADGITWTQPSSYSTTSSSFNSVAYSPDSGLWTAVTQNGQIHTASDPTGTWTQQTSPFTSTDFLGPVAYGNGKWVAVSRGSASLATATDPTGTWTINSGTGFTKNFNYVAYGGGVWVATAGQTNGSGDLWTATDPAGTWTKNSNTLFTGSWPWPAASNFPRILGYINVPECRGVWVCGQSSGFGYTGIAVDPTGVWYQGPPPASTFALLGTATGSDGNVLMLGQNAYLNVDTGLGWVPLTATASSTTLVQYLYWRIAKSSESATNTFTITSNKASAVASSLSEAAPEPPPGAWWSAQANASSATVSFAATGTIPAAPSGMAIVLGGTQVGTTVLANPSGYTLDSQGASTGGSTGSRTTTAGFHQLLSNAGTSASGSFTYNAAAVNVGHHVYVPQAYHTLAGAPYNRLAGTAVVPQTVGRSANL